MSQLVPAKSLGEDIDNLLICQNIHKFYFTGEDSLVDEMIVYLDVLCQGVEDRVLRKLDIIEVVAIYHCQFKHLHL